MSPAAAWSVFPDYSDVRWWQQGCIVPSSLMVVVHFLEFLAEILVLLLRFSCPPTEALCSAASVWGCLDEKTFLTVLHWIVHRGQAGDPPAGLGAPQIPSGAAGSSLAPAAHRWFRLQPCPWPGLHRGGSGVAAAPRAVRLFNSVALMQWPFTSSQLHLHMQQIFFFYFEPFFAVCVHKLISRSTSVSVSKSVSSSFLLDHSAETKTIFRLSCINTSGVMWNTTSGISHCDCFMCFQISQTKEPKLKSVRAEVINNQVK